MIQADRLLGLLACLVAALLMWVVIPAQTSTASYGSTSPAMFPLIGAAAVGIGALWLMIAPRSGATIDLRPAARAIGIALLGAAGFGALDWLGYVWIASPLVLTLMLLVGQRNPLWLVAGGIAAPLGIWAIFVMVLDRPLP